MSSKSQLRVLNFSQTPKDIQTLLKHRPLIRFEGFELDPLARQLARDGEPISLSPKTFDLLLYLVEHPHQVVAKDELLSAIWPDTVVEESNLSQHVFLLRKALAVPVLAGSGSADSRTVSPARANAGRSGRIVVTIPGRGYQFAADVEQEYAEPGQALLKGQGSSSEDAASSFAQIAAVHAVHSVTHVVVTDEYEDDAPVALSSDEIRTGAANPARRRWRVAAWVAGGLLLLGGAAIAGWQWMRPKPSGPIDLVVSGVENTTGDADFDRSLTQALQIDLEQSPFLNLLPRSMVRQTLLEMQHKGDEPLTPVLAAEVCQRNNAQATIGGSIARVGSQYLLILKAESCISGKQLAGYKTEISSKDEILAALDRGAARVRQQLGESEASRERYEMPIAAATTPSFPALLAYNQAGESFRRGDMKASQILLERSIALDPNFASAYRILGSSYYNLGDFTQASEYYKKAFDLRERTTEREGLGIEVMYYGYALQDYDESIRRTRQFLQIYPNVTNSWVSLSNLYDLLGQYPQALEAAQHAFKLDPHSGVAAVELTRSYLRLSRFSEAKETAHTAVAAGKDHWDIHSTLYQIAFAEKDAAAMKAEGEWGLTHQHVNTSLQDLAFGAASRGQLRLATEDFERARAAAMRSGERDFSNGALLHQAQVETELEQPLKAMATLRQMKGDAGDPSNPGQIAVLKAVNGDVAGARQFLNSADAEDNRKTVEHSIYLPLVKALLALKAKRPAEAVQAMEAARPYQLADFEIPYYRAQAEAADGNLAAAEADYRLILANPGVDPISPLYTLAHLRLARVLVRAKKEAAARAEYQSFLDTWREGDKELPMLVAARAEMERLAAKK
jgi:DNA-binding winged helix-turn-helix (wHTH) protein/tetratricopeptide (TPR) repeat protein